MLRFTIPGRRSASAEIYDSRQKVGELRQLVVMRRKEHTRLRVFLPLQKFDDRPCDAEAVVGRRAAAHFVEDDEASVRRVAQDVRGLDHLDHEGALPARELVARAYRVKTRSMRPIFALSAGTKEPMCAIIAMSAAVRR